MTRLAEDALTGVQPDTAVPPYQRIALDLTRPVPDYPEMIHEQVNRELRRRARAREARERQLAFLLFGVHL